MMSQYMLTKHKKNANILKFTPPGFKNSIDVPFPPRCLAVCERCKKNFKTREHCRTRDCHTDLPWSDTYLCIVLDRSCISEDNKLLDGPFVARTAKASPYCLQGDIDPLTPICAPCKDKNYTRTYCRSNKKHRYLPWSTVYVELFLKPDGLFHENNDRDIQGPSKRRKTGADVQGTSGEDRQGNDKIKEVGDEKEAEDSKNKFDDIPPTRAFLCTVSAKKCDVKWLDIDPMHIDSPTSRRDEYGFSGRLQDDPSFGSYTIPYGVNFPGPTVKAEDPRRGGPLNITPDQFMAGRFPRGSYNGQEMLGGQIDFESSQMSRRVGYNGFPSPQEMTYLEALNMPQGARHSDMGQGTMPFDSNHAAMRGMSWGSINQSEIPHMNFDRMPRAPGQDLMPPHIPPHMWPMANSFMRGGSSSGPHGGNNRLDYSGNPLPSNGSNNVHEGDMNGYRGAQGYPSHQNNQGGGMTGGGGAGNGDEGGGVGPPKRSPQDGEEKS